MEQSSSARSTQQPANDTIGNLISALSAPPASFVWSAGERAHSALLGTSEGIVVQIMSDKVECIAVMAPDAPTLAQNNATLLLLILTAMRDDWQEAGDWLAREMRQAAQSMYTTYSAPNYAQSCCFEFRKRFSQALLTIKRL